MLPRNHKRHLGSSLALLLTLLLTVACQQNECEQCQGPSIVEVPVTVVVTPTAPAVAEAGPTATQPLPTSTTAPPEPTATTAAPSATAPAFQLPETQAYQPGPNAFVETFDGAPAQPTGWSSPRWDITIHSRDWGTWYDPVPMAADHGPDCGAPPTTHPITSYDGSIYNCRDHLMTAINGPGYAMIYLTPDHMVDFSEGTAIIRWDMSTFRKSQRDWVDVWITPYDVNNQLTLLSWLPDLNGPAQDAVHVEMQDIVNTFNVGIIRDFEDQRLEGEVSRHGYDRFLEPSQTRRDVFEIQISTNHVRVGMPDYDFWWIDEPIEPPLTWTEGVIQFGHHSYNPTKSCDDSGECGPTTWHWDNVIIDPAKPFSIIKPDVTYINQPEGQTVTFDQPAPADSHLRFSGFSDTIEVSYDGGQSWQPAQRQRQMEEHVDRFQAYWMPVPAGTQQIQFRGTDRWSGGWFLRDIAIWSTDSSAAARDTGRFRIDFSNVDLTGRYCVLPDNRPG
ncbi:MAG: hypothetical protein KDE04_02835, partial [Anaerolineales bacterium]|nr:hypothetical protein [Anaerolineales bacterium]